MNDGHRVEETPRRPALEQPPHGAPKWSRTPLPFGIAAATLATALVAFSVSRDPTRWPSQAKFVVWNVLLLLSFAGWGTIAVRAFGVRSMRGFVRVALGIAALIAVSGFLLALHALSFFVLGALVVVGVGAELFSLLERATRRARERASGIVPLHGLEHASFGDLAYGVAAGVVLLVAALRILGAAKLTLGWWDADDTPAYWAFIRELTARGSFDQVFSFRRLVAFGGQTVLQAVTCLGLPVRSVNVFDVGLCPFVMIGMVLQVGRGRWLAIAVGLLLALLPTSALNSASNFSGSLLFVVVYFALRFASAESPRRGGALTGMTAAALCTLRHSFIPGCGVLLAAATVAHFSEPGVRRWRNGFDFLWTLAVAFAVTIAPWSLASLIACHTPLFPLVHGTYRAGGVDLGTGGPVWLLGLKGIVDNPPPVPQLLAVFGAILALGAVLSRASFVPLALGTLACTLALARAAPLNPSDDVRYLAAPWIALLLVFYVEALLGPRGTPQHGRGVLPVAAVATVLVAFQLAAVLSPGLALVYQDVGVRTAFRDWPEEAVNYANARALQAHIPEGKTVLAACDRVYHYDFGRNKIVLVDLPTVASPFKLPDENATPAQYERVISELRRRGIDYLLFTNPDASSAMYSAPRWASFRNDGYRTHDLLAPRFAAWFDFERYVLAHRRIRAKLDNDELAELASVKSQGGS